MENVVVAIFKNESEGFQAATELKNTAVGGNYTISQLELVQKKYGRIDTVDGFDTGVDTTDDSMQGMLIGGLIGILGGPLGVLLGMSWGGLIGVAVDAGDAADDISLLEQVSGKLEDGDTAIIALVREENENVIDSLLSKFDVEIIRFDAAVIAQEVEEAKEAEKELKKHAKRELKAQKKADRKQKIEEKRGKIKNSFDEKGGETEG